MSEPNGTQLTFYQLVWLRDATYRSQDRWGAMVDIPARRAYVERVHRAFVEKGILAPGAPISGAVGILLSDPLRVMDAYRRRPGNAARALITDTWFPAVPQLPQRLPRLAPYCRQVARNLLHAGVEVTAGDPSDPAVDFLFAPVGERSPAIRSDIRAASAEFTDALEGFLKAELTPSRLRAMLEQPRRPFNPADPRSNFTTLRRVVELAGERAGLYDTESGLDLRTEAVILGTLAAGMPDAVLWAISGHKTLAMMPIALFGTEDQRTRFLGPMARGERIGAFAITEDGAGSDAAAIRTTATRAADGSHYILNGAKIFCTNGAFADLIIVTARSEEGISTFIVETDTPGFNVLGNEEKIGNHEASTASFRLDDVKVPATNLLGKLGKGLSVAFSTLTTGRFNQGAAAAGNTAALVTAGVRWAKERVQFGRPIAEFFEVQRDLAEAAILTFAIESMVDRMAGEFDDRTAHHSLTTGEGRMTLWRTFELPATIIKVLSTDYYFAVADRIVQVYGGHGYVAEALPARALCDARVTRIFEGANGLLRGAVIGPRMLKAISSRSESRLSPDEVERRLKAVDSTFYHHPLRDAIRAAEQAKLLTRSIFALALHSDHVMEEMSDPARGQVLTERLAQLAMRTYAIDSVVAHALKLCDLYGPERASTAILIAKLYAHREYRRLFHEEVAGFTAHAFRNTLRKYPLHWTFRSDIRGLVPRAASDTDGSLKKVAEDLVARGSYQILPN